MYYTCRARYSLPDIFASAEEQDRVCVGFHFDNFTPFLGGDMSLGYEQTGPTAGRDAVVCFQRTHLCAGSGLLNEFADEMKISLHMLIVISAICTGR